MKIANFLGKNIKWNVAKDYFADLRCTPTSEEALVNQLHRLSDRYFPERRKIETAFSEFCLNEIALATPKTAAQNFVKRRFDEFWRAFLRLKKAFDNPFCVFPADGEATRLEYISKLLAQCTQFAATKREFESIFNKIRSIFDLDERERRHLENVVNLFEINYFCAVARGVFRGEKRAEIRLAKMFDSCKIADEFAENKALRQCILSDDRLVANVNCLSASATKFFAPTQIEVKHFFFCNGKNVFDTFCFSKLGNNTAEFFSESGVLRVEMQYFLQDSCEIRRYSVTNTGKTSKKITTDFLFGHTNKSDKTEYFPSEGALCLSVEGENQFYCALALVSENKVASCEFEEGRISQIFAVLPGETTRFEIVTAFAENMPNLAEILQDLNNFGATRCPFLSDTLSQNIINTEKTLHVTPHGYLARQNPQKQATTFNFTYQLGDEKGATFLDNAGNCTTLLDGFVFGVGGEKVYSVKNGVLRMLNCREFSLSGDVLEYRKPQNTVCKINHDDGKIYTVHYANKQRTLFLFPFEESSVVTKTSDGFIIRSQLRDFSVKYEGSIESFTTNALECNAERLRYKLSDDITCGTCLAICFAPSETCKLKISNRKSLPDPTPIVRESLISTYLNYVNNKNVFCICNLLKRVDSLTLAAICYTNRRFVEYYVKHMFKTHRFFYDVAGERKSFFDRLALPLAIVYCANISIDESFPTTEHKKFAETILLKETFEGKEICIQALALKKAARVTGFDKVKCLVEYANLKKKIVGDSKLYAYAQAIGAVALCQPGKERLKDLCGTFNLPKSWYYVSQLENLYGLTLAEGTLQFVPKVTQANVLEQLALDLEGKRIDTSFTRSAVSGMTLNGVQYFVPVKTASLKNSENKLEVRY